MTSNLSRLVIGTKPNPNCLIRSPERLDLSRCSPSATFSKSSDVARRSKSIAPYPVVFPCSLAFDRAIPEVGSFKTEGVTAKTSYGTLSAAFPTQVPPRPDLPMTQVIPRNLIRPPWTLEPSVTCQSTGQSSVSCPVFNLPSAITLQPTQLLTNCKVLPEAEDGRDILGFGSRAGQSQFEVSIDRQPPPTFVRP